MSAPRSCSHVTLPLCNLQGGCNSPSYSCHLSSNQGLFSRGPIHQAPRPVCIRPSGCLSTPGSDLGAMGARMGVGRLAPLNSPACHFPSHRPPSGSIRLRAAGCDPGATEGDGMRLSCGRPGWGPCRTPGSRNQRSGNWIWRLRVEGCDRVAATCKFSTRRLSLPQERAGLGWGVCAVGLGARRWGARREAKTCSGQRPGHRARVGARAAASKDKEVVDPAAGGALQPCRPWALAPGQSGSG